jgi:Ca2+-binding EF-hand superfamily protein
LQEFELTLNVEKFIAEVDKDASGWIEYEEFRLLLA